MIKKIYRRLGKPELAINDANKALGVKGEDPKAFAAKAEAFFNCGHFEDALVQYERAKRIGGTQQMDFGLRKARQALLDVLSGETFKFGTQNVLMTLSHNCAKKSPEVIQSSSGRSHCQHRGKLNRKNVLKEEAEFLKDLMNLDKFNVDIQVKKGCHSLRSQVEIYLIYTKHYK